MKFRFCFLIPVNTTLFNMLRSCLGGETYSPERLGHTRIVFEELKYGRIFLRQSLCRKILNVSHGRTNSCFRVSKRKGYLVAGVKFVQSCRPVCSFNTELYCLSPFLDFSKPMFSECKVHFSTPFLVVWGW